MNKAFFLDRDGTINVDYNFVHTSEEWTWCEGAIEAIRWLNRADFKVIVVTNQSGISRGRYTKEQVYKLHQWVNRQLHEAKAHIDDWYMAPYHPKFEQASQAYPKEDRKPGLGMFKKAAEKHHIDLENSYMAGDKITDLKPAIELGITPFFIKSRHEPRQDKNWLQEHNLAPYLSLKQVLKDRFHYE